MHDILEFVKFIYAAFWTWIGFTIWIIITLIPIKYIVLKAAAVISKIEKRREK